MELTSKGISSGELHLFRSGNRAGKSVFYGIHRLAIASTYAISSTKRLSEIMDLIAPVAIEEPAKFKRGRVDRNPPRQFKQEKLPQGFVWMRDRSGELVKMDIRRVRD